MRYVGAQNWNKITGIPVFLGVAAVKLPAAIERQCGCSLDHRSGSIGSNLRSIISRGTEMKTLLLAGAAVALLTTVNFSPAIAQGPRPSSGNTWPGISQRVDPGASTVAAANLRYEFQYGYDKHAAWRGYWVLVK